MKKLKQKILLILDAVLLNVIKIKGKKRRKYSGND
jgi:hypothetical protein